jgi:predicted PurR-regulated permease PerM
MSDVPDSLEAAGTGARAETSTATVPVWLVNLAALSWRLVVVVAMLAAAWFIGSTLSTVTAAVAVAIVVGAVLAPATLRLRRQGRSTTAAAAIVWAVSLLVVVVLAVALAFAFLPYVADLLGTIRGGTGDLGSWLASLSLPPLAASLTGDAVDAAQAVVGDAASAVAAQAAGIVTSLVLATFLVFFFLRDGDRAWAWCVQGMDASRQQRITTAGQAALGRIGGYLVGTTVLSAVVALTDLVFMLLLRVPLPIPMAVLVFLSGYIPYFGGIVTTLLVLALTLGSVGVVPTLVMIVLLAVRNALMAWALRPTVYGRSVRLHPALVLVALPAGFQIAGVIGLFAAVPFAAVVLAVASAVVAVIEPDPAPPLPGLVPAWLDRMAQWSWRLLAALALVALVVASFAVIPLVLVPVVLGVILAATFAPAVEALARRGRSRGSSAAIVLGGTSLGIAIVLLLTVGILVGEGAAIAASATAGAEGVNDAAGGSLGLLVDAVRSFGLSAVTTLVSLSRGIASAAVVVVLSLLLGFYLLRDGGQLWARVVARARPATADEVRATGRRSFEVLGGYMYGTAAISLVGAASQLVIMLLLHIPLAVPVFVLSFFLCFIPYIGGFISTGAALLLTIATGSPLAIAVMVVWTIVFNIVTGNIVSPIVYGKTVHLHPAVVLVAIPIGSTVAGVLGMLLVVPLLGVVAVSWRTVVRVLAASSAGGGSAASGAGTAAVTGDGDVLQAG